MQWKIYFKTIANAVKKKSKDKLTQIGAVIVGQNNQIISTGYNSFPRRINDNVEERQQRPQKYYWMEHAERNAIYNAALNGVSTKNASIYLSCNIPCADCARAIINAGIIKVYCQKNNSSTNNDFWDQHIKRSKIMFQQSGVQIIFY